MDTTNNSQSILQGTQSNSSALNPAPSIVADQTYLENILRLNIGKLGTFFFTYTGSSDWRDRAYKGTIEQVGRDHFIVRDPKNQKFYIFQFVYFDWAEFDEPLNFNSR